MRNQFAIERAQSDTVGPTRTLIATTTTAAAAPD